MQFVSSSALTVLAWRHGLHASCTRELVPLLTHVEAMRVACSGGGGRRHAGSLGALDLAAAAAIGLAHLGLAVLALYGCWQCSARVERWVQGLQI